MLFASGIIAGESLAGVAIALPKSAGIEDLGIDFPFTSGLTAAAALAMVVLFYFMTRPDKEARR